MLTPLGEIYTPGTDDVEHFIFQIIGELLNSSESCQLRREVLSPPKLKRNQTWFTWFWGWGQLVEMELVGKHGRVSHDTSALALGWIGLPDGGGGEVALKCRGEEGKEGGS